MEKRLRTTALKGAFFANRIHFPSFLTKHSRTAPTSWALWLSRVSGWSAGMQSRKSCCRTSFGICAEQWSAKEWKQRFKRRFGSASQLVHRPRCANPDQRYIWYRFWPTVHVLYILTNGTYGTDSDQRCIWYRFWPTVHQL